MYLSTCPLSDAPLLLSLANLMFSLMIVVLVVAGATKKTACAVNEQALYLIIRVNYVYSSHLYLYS